MAYHLDWIELVCPRCKGELTQRPARDSTEDHMIHCPRCPHDYPVVLGIPDLRVFADPYISFEGDLIKGRMLATAFASSDLGGMATTYYHITPETPPRDVALNLVRLRKAVDRSLATLAAWGIEGDSVEGSSMLEVGCGTAPLLVAAHGRFRKLVGVDVSFRWLVMGRRRLADHGLSIPLIAACGEALPFRNEAFGTVAMDSYLEITANQPAALAESTRVLRAGGRILVSTPNRWSPGPDPHIGVLAGGLLPAGVVNTIAKQRMARPPRRRLLTASGLRRALRSAGLEGVAVQLPALSEAQLATVGGIGRGVGRLYNTLRTHWLTRELLKLVGPILHASGRKP